MSLEQYRAAWRYLESDAAKVLNSTERLVLVALAEFADRDGVAWPSVDRLARRCGVDRRTLQRALRVLEAADVVECVVQGGPSRHGGFPNLYRLHPERGGAYATPRGAARTSPRRAERGGAYTTGRGGNFDKNGAARTPREPSLEQPSIEPSVTIAPTHASARARDVEIVRVSEVEIVDAGDPPNRPRRRNPDRLFDAVVAALDVNVAEITTSARGALNRAVKELRDVDADPAEVPVRVEILRRQWHGEVKITPTAFAKHYAECAPRLENLTGADREAAELAAEIAKARRDERAHESYDSYESYGGAAKTPTSPRRRDGKA